MLLKISQVEKGSASNRGMWHYNDETLVNRSRICSSSLQFLIKSSNTSIPGWQCNGNIFRNTLHKRNFWRHVLKALLSLSVTVHDFMDWSFKQNICIFNKLSGERGFSTLAGALDHDTAWTFELSHVAHWDKKTNWCENYRCHSFYKGISGDQQKYNTTFSF